LGFHSVLRDAEFGGDFLMRRGVEQAEGDDLPAALGKVAHGGGEQRELLLFVDGVGDIGAVLGDGQGREIVHSLDGNDFASAEEIEGGVARGGKEKRLGIADPTGIAGVMSRA